MKNQVFFRAILFFSVVIFAYACGKDDQAVQKPQKPEEPVTLTSAIVGKWTIGSATNVSPKTQDESKILFIEFFKDSTYIVSISSGEIYTGKYGLTDTTKINISELGTLSDIKIEGEKLNFMLSTRDGAILIIANKVPEISESEETNKFCRTWKLVSENWSPVTFGWSGENKHAHLRFSNSGTYLFTVRTLQDSVADIRSGNWNWVPALPNSYQYNGYSYIENRNMTSTIEITKLTSDSLIIKDQYYTYPSNDGVKIDTTLNIKTHAFVPVN